MDISPELARKMQKLSEAINVSLSDSDAIAAAVHDIKASGYEVCLVLEAGIGLTPIEGFHKDEEPVKFSWNSQDDEWLKAMKVGMPEK